jgi:hypothetical protein
MCSSRNRRRWRSHGLDKAAPSHYPLILTLGLALVVASGFALSLAFLPAVALIFAVIVVVGLLAFPFPLILPVVAAVMFAKKRITKNDEQVFVAIVPCSEGNKTDQKSAESLPTILSTNDSIFTSHFSPTSDLLTTENLPDVFMELEDLTEKTDESSHSLDELSSIFGEESDIEFITREKVDKEEWRKKVAGWEDLEVGSC